MKKITALILVLTLALALCGCANLENLKNVDIPPLPEATEEPTPEPEATPVPTEEIDTSDSTAQSTVPNHVIVSIENHSEEHYDPQYGTTCILTFSYDTLEVYIEGRDDATQAVNEYLATLDDTYYTGNSYDDTEDDSEQPSGMSGYLEQATDNYVYAVQNGLTDLPLEFSCLRTTSVGRLDDQVISLLYNTNTYTGGAHGSYVNRGYVFDSETGEVVTLDTLSEGHEDFKTFAANYMLQLYQQDEDSYYSERVATDMLTTDVNSAITAVLRDGSWLFNDEGMYIFSDLYELGPYAAGLTEFLIPYSELEGQIDDKWLPQSHVDSETDGSIELKAQSDVADGSIEIIDKVVVDEDQTQLCLVADGTIYDVLLSEVGYNGSSFYESSELWAASYMSDCALQLVTQIPEGMPNLRISYKNAAGEETSLLLSQSGEDGGYILVNEADIEAVG